MKKLIKILAGLLVVLVLALVAAAYFLGSIVKKGVETVGPRLTQVETKLGSARIGLLSGSGMLKDLFVGNPKGFNSPSAITAGEISVAVQPRSVMSDKVVITSVRIVAPEITLHGLGGDNLKKILENVRAATGSRDKKDDKSAKKIQVDDLLIQGGKVTVILPVLGSAVVALPDIHLTDLGKGSEGLRPDELASKVLNAVLNSATSVAADAGKGALGAFQGSGTEPGKQVEKVTKGLGNLLGK